MNGLSKDRDNTIKLVTVGDGSVGKTSVLISYTLNRFPRDYTPTVFDTYAVSVSLDSSEHYVLSLFDTAGQEDYLYLRTLAYPNADVFLVCFALDNPDSLENAVKMWIPEIKRSHYIYNSSPCFILVGTKCDIRSDETWKGASLVSHKTASRMAKRCGALDYVECSALTQEGLQHVFKTAILSVVTQRKCDSKIRENNRIKSCGKPGFKLGQLFSKCLGGSDRFS